MMKLSVRQSMLFVLLSLAGCLFEAPTASEFILNDAGLAADTVSDRRVADALTRDSGPARDSGERLDVSAVDTGELADAGFVDADVHPDAAPRDSGAVDAPAGYVAIPAGSFLMGSPTGEPNRYPDEGPLHRVEITRGFFMKQTEITRAEWFAVMRFLPQPLAPCSATPDDNCPVTGLDRDLLILYTNTLSIREGLPECYTGNSGNRAFAGLDCQGYRLPTEAEWEYAARAGTATPYPVVPGLGHTLSDIAWYLGNSRDNSDTPLIQPVAGLQPNGWGLYDIIGNAHEINHGRLTEDYSGASATDPLESGAVPLSFWSTRGGAYTFPEADCRSATRGGHPIGRFGTTLHGGRPVRTAP